MKLRQPWVLLLGGLLSAFSVGCSAITAVVSDSRPAARHSRGSADQMAAIARVYENQGRYDQAEVMYRKALKQNPNNVGVRSSLQQLADKKSERKFGAESLKSAVANRSTIDTIKPLARESSAKAGVKSPPITVPSVVSILASTEDKSADAIEQSAVGFASASSNSMKTVVQKTSAETVKPEETQPFLTVTADEILRVVDTPALHSDLILNGLLYGDSLETQCLAATLMGDCDRSNEKIRELLKAANQSATDPYLRLAVCDSRIQRGEQDSATAECLTQLIDDAPMEIRIQACSNLHHFVGSDCETMCIASLQNQLKNDEQDMRASAAVALGDFNNLQPELVAQLNQLSESDASIEVQDAAKSALSRIENKPSEKNQAIIVTPRG